MRQDATERNGQREKAEKAIEDSDNRQNTRTMKIEEEEHEYK